MRLGSRLLVVLALACPPPAFAQVPVTSEEYVVTTWTIENGLPQGSINDLLQTDDGALWIATFGGLLRFDGVEFRTFDLETLPSLPSVRITSLARDGAGGLWLLLQSSWLIHLQEGRVTGRVRITDTLLDLLGIASVTVGTVQELWVRGTGGLLCRVRGAEVSAQNPSQGPPQQYQDFCGDTEGGLAIAQDELLMRMSHGQLVGPPVRAPSRILELAPAGSGRLWVGLVDGLARASGSSIERAPTDVPLKGVIHALVDDGQGGVWVGTTHGLVHVVPRSPEAGGAPYAVTDALLNGLSIQCLLLDREQNLWVGMRGMGLARVTRKRVEVYRPAARDTAVAAMASDGNGGAWVSLAKGGLMHGVLESRADGAGTLKWASDDIPTIFGLLRDSEGSTWAAHDRKLSRIDGGPRVEVPLQPRLGGIAATAQGDLWVATQDGRFLVLVDRNGSVLQTLEPAGRVISVTADPRGGIWIGETDRLEYLHQGRLESFGQELGVPRGDVRSVLPEADGSVWIATYGGGLGHLQDGRVSRIGSLQGLPNLALSHIQDDGLGRFWLLSNQGLIVVDRTELLAVSQGRKARIDPVVIGPAAGMPEGNFGLPAGFRDELGQLWFGTLAGPVRVDPRSFPQNRRPPSVRIEAVSSDDNPLELTATLRVPPATRRLDFKFTTFSLTAPELVHFRYRLDGFDEAWNESGARRSATYTGLRPGTYSFHVEARNEDGVWSTIPATLRFDVAPSWWETNLFRTALVFAAVASLYAVDRLRIGIIRRRARALLEATEGRARAEERESRLREELAHIGRVATAGELASSLAHEVNQPLAAIVTNAQAGTRYLARESWEKRDIEPILLDIAAQGHRASEIVRRLREFLRKHESERRTLDLNQVVRETLPLVRRELQDNRVDLVLELDPALRKIDADPVQMQQVLVNFVKNACEAMAGTKGERVLEVRTHSTSERVTLEVHDSGPGLAPDVVDKLFQPYVTTKPSGMGLGLAICRSIVEAHGGRIDARASDRSGTTFRVELPAIPEPTPTP